MSGVFDPKNCEIQFVAQIDPINGVTDCSIKDAPEPIHDCNDQVIALPAPRGLPGEPGAPADPDLFFSQITLVDLTYNNVTNTLSVNLDDLFSDITLVGLSYNSTTNTLSANGESSDTAGIVITSDLAPASWNSSECKLMHRQQPPCRA
jgi:hypothetical protein